jgi:DNA-binding winged helix-turn-helix (wHTH) protein
MGTQMNPVVPQDGNLEVVGAGNFPTRYARFGNFQVDLQREELHQDNRRVKMQAQVYRALLLLLSRPGEIISREEVRKWLWPEAFLANLDANVNTTMNKLRQVLGDSPEAPRYIETMPRRGYSFIAAVKFSDQPALQSAGITPSAAREAAHSSPEDIPMPVRQRFGAVLRMSGFLIAGILLGALLTFVWFFAQAKEHRAVQTGKPGASKPIASSAMLDAGDRRA